MKNNKDENYNYHEMKDYVFIGAYEGADCIGLAILTPVFNPCLFLYDLKVKCKMRGKGIGKQLIKASYQYAIAKGYAGLYTVGQDNNLNACLFYLACGFEIGGLDTKIYENTKQSGKFDINLLYALKISTLNEFRFIGEIAKPAEPVNGQDGTAHKCAANCTIPPVFAKG